VVFRRQLNKANAERRKPPIIIRKSSRKSLRI
jgi:hypothetical protein